MPTIPIVVESEPELESGTLGLRGPSAKITHIDADRLRESLSDLTDQITGLFTDIKSVGDYKLKEVQVSLEISAEGGVALIGTAKAGAKGAVTLTFAL